MQIRVQNKRKSVRKSRYFGDVSAPHAGGAPQSQGQAKRGARAPWERRRGARVTGGRRNSRGYLVKRKHMLIKVNVPASEHTMGDGIIAPISLGVGGVADEDASDRSRCKLVRSSVGSAGIAKAPKNTQAVIRWGVPKRRW